MSVLRTGRLSTHADRLERWLGPEVHRISAAMTDWYGPPILVGQTPGPVFAHRGGDFSGPIRVGRAQNICDYVRAKLKLASVLSRRQMCTLNMAGFASLSDLISEASNGKQQEVFFQKFGPTGVASVTSTLWRVGSLPAAGNAGSAAPAGRAPIDTTTGAYMFNNPASGDTLHIITAYSIATLQGTLLMYDRIFDVAKTINSTATEAVTGVPTRYQNTVASAADYIGGNFLFVEVGATALAATAHNWTVCLYRNQANVQQTLPVLVGNASAIVDRLDHPANQWFAPLANDDVGVKEIDQMQCSALVATGAINFVIGHPMCWMPCPQVNLLQVHDRIRTGFGVVRVFDDAAMSLLDVLKPAATASTYNVQVSLVAG